MKYMLLICRDPAIKLSPDERAAMPGWVTAWVEEMESRNILLPGGGELRSADNATTVRVRGEETLLTDGPFAETKDQIGGFDIVQCADLDAAITVASSHPVARFGSIEVRPFVESG